MWAAPPGPHHLQDKCEARPREASLRVTGVRHACDEQPGPPLPEEKGVRLPGLLPEAS